MRANTEFSRYNRAIVLQGKTHDGKNALSALATNEIQMLYLLVRWSGCTDTGYAMAGLKIEPKGAFERPSMDHIVRVARMFKR